MPREPRVPPTLTRYSPPDASRAQSLAGAPLASFGRRAGALAIDFLISGVLFMAVTVGGSMLLRRFGLIAPDTDLKFELTFFDDWLSLVWLVAYFGVLLYLGQGRTPGKRLLGLRVVSLEHEQIGFLHSIERALGYGASALEFGLGFAQYFWSSERRTAHDRLAGTIVVDEREKAA